MATDDESHGPGYTRLVLEIVAGILILVVGLLMGICIGTSLSGSAIGTRFASDIVDALAWPSAVLILAMLFQRPLVHFLARVEWFEGFGIKMKARVQILDTLMRRVREAGEVPEKPDALSLISPKERILNKWQDVHDALADLYTTAERGAQAPTRFRALASRLRRRGHLPEAVAQILDEVRGMYRDARRAAEQQVPVALADYYEQVVTQLLSLIDTRRDEFRRAESPNKANGP
ncbi:MAG TPA: hypothetical protein VMY37_16765 [Thermoguttaceae bacterium]|nr:hypothetical protein [Thermoguttaceae bacterium]